MAKEVTMEDLEQYDDDSAGQDDVGPSYADAIETLSEAAIEPPSEEGYDDGVYVDEPPDGFYDEGYSPAPEPEASPQQEASPDHESPYAGVAEELEMAEAYEREQDEARIDDLVARAFLVGAEAKGMAGADEAERAAAAAIARLAAAEWPVVEDEDIAAVVAVEQSTSGLLPFAEDAAKRQAEIRRGLDRGERAKDGDYDPFAAARLAAFLRKFAEDSPSRGTVAIGLSLRATGTTNDDFSASAALDNQVNGDSLDEAAATAATRMLTFVQERGLHHRIADQAVSEAAGSYPDDELGKEQPLTLATLPTLEETAALAIERANANPALSRALERRAIRNDPEAFYASVEAALLGMAHPDLGKGRKKEHGNARAAVGKLANEPIPAAKTPEPKKVAKMRKVSIGGFN